MEYVKIYFLIGLGLAVYSVLLEMVIYGFGGLSSTDGFFPGVFFFAVNVLLWPLMVYVGGKRLNPFSQYAREAFVSTKRIRRDVAERKQLRENPPRCSSVIQFNAGAILGCEKEKGIFTFDAKDAEEKLDNALRQFPRLQHDEEGRISNWLAGRDTQVTTPVTVPRIWPKFVQVADELVREGRGQVTCSECGQHVPFKDLIYKDDDGQRGPNYNRIYCPKGHALMKWVHIYFS